MAKKSELRKAIADSKREIEALEKKRMRSQTSLLEAFLAKQTPSESDAEYFRVYTSLIELERANLRRLSRELEELGG